MPTNHTDNQGSEGRARSDYSGTCWVCGSSLFEFYKSSDIQGELSSDSFAITDSDYGKSGELVRCQECGFIQCTDLQNVVHYYEDMQDIGYEESRQERALQSRHLLKLLPTSFQGKRLLDIGAGSGILLEEAIRFGYEAEGVEPSKWLHNLAVERNLPVQRGVFPHRDIGHNNHLRVTLWTRYWKRALGHMKLQQPIYYSLLGQPHGSSAFRDR